MSDTMNAAQFNAAARVLGMAYVWRDDGDDQAENGELIAHGQRTNFSNRSYASDLKAIRNHARHLAVFPASPVEPAEKIYERNPGVTSPYHAVQLVDAERLAERLMTVLPLGSKSCQEQPFAEFAKTALSALGVQTRVDDLPQHVAALVEKDRVSGEQFYCNAGKTAPTAGNVIGVLPATDPQLPSWNLSFHLDTNQVAFEGIARQGDVIRPGPGTPLGGDDKCGYAIIAEVIQILQDNKIPHGDIYIVGLAGEEQGSIGARLIEPQAFKGDILVSVDGTEPQEIGRAAPTMYKGLVEIETQTSHPFDFDKKRSVSSLAVAGQILSEFFRPDGHPFGNPNVIFHPFYIQSGLKVVDANNEAWVHAPAAKPIYNTVVPYTVFLVQMRSLEGKEKAAALAAQFTRRVEEICAEAAKGRTPVKCTVSGMDGQRLVGYAVPESHPAIQILASAFKLVGMEPHVTARQFGGFNGNYVWSRADIGKSMLLLGTGADQIHTNEETVSVQAMTKVARGLLAAMLESYLYNRVEPK